MDTAMYVRDVREPSCQFCGMKNLAYMCLDSWHRVWCILCIGCFEGLLNNTVFLEQIDDILPFNKPWFEYLVQKVREKTHDEFP